jgi:hypothetical protein
MILKDSSDEIRSLAQSVEKGHSRILIAKTLRALADKLDKFHDTLVMAQSSNTDPLGPKLAEKVPEIDLALVPQTGDAAADVVEHLGWFKKMVSFLGA